MSAQGPGFSWRSILDDGYPVRIDLAEVEAATRERDRSAIDLELMQDRAQATAEDLALAASPVGVETLPQPVDAAQEQAEGSDAIETDDAALAANQGGLMPIQFDLARPSEGATIQLSKNVQFGDQSLGQIDVRIDDNSSIFLSTADLIRILPPARRPAVPSSGEFVSMAALRRAGLDLRYDPNVDRLMLAP